MRKTFLLLVLCTLWLPCTAALQTDISARDSVQGCPFVHIDVERLPDLNIPRGGHSTHYADGELTVFGGHTSGFVPTPTAEYFRDGEWHLMDMVYPHDAGCAVALKSGQVLIAGGMEKELGIGQTFTVEMYDPATHTFDGFGCLDRKRSMPSAVEMNSGHVVVAGNWYEADGIGLFDGSPAFRSVGEVALGRSRPVLLRTSGNNVLIMSYWDPHGKLLDTTLVDRLHGGPIHVPLLRTWHNLVYEQIDIHSDNFFIGDAERGIFEYLVPVCNDSQQIAILHVQDTIFSILPTTCTIPMHCPVGNIDYKALTANRAERVIYLSGYTTDFRRLIVARIDYSETPAPVTLCYTDTLEELAPLASLPVLTPEGDLVIVGGVTTSNFYPKATAYKMLVGKHTAESARNKATAYWWIIGLLSAAALLLGGYMYDKKHKANKIEETKEATETEEAEVSEETTETIEATEANTTQEPIDTDIPQDSQDDLEEEPPFDDEYFDEEEEDDDYEFEEEEEEEFHSSFNPEDVIIDDELIRRVHAAQQLLRENPDMDLSVVALRAGFVDEIDFFHSFIAYEGITPCAWKYYEL